MIQIFPIVGYKISSVILNELRFSTCEQQTIFINYNNALWLYTFACKHRVCDEYKVNIYQQNFIQHSVNCLHNWSFA